jgi:hypothetical protein
MLAVNMIFHIYESLDIYVCPYVNHSRGTCLVNLLVTANVIELAHFILVRNDVLYFLVCLLRL